MKNKPLEKLFICLHFYLFYSFPVLKISTKKYKQKAMRKNQVQLVEAPMTLAETGCVGPV
jgi:hypothetical protein